MTRKTREAVEVSHKTVEVLLKELAEQSRSYQQALEKLLREKAGTSAYDGNLGKVWAEAEVLATKAQHAKMVIDEYTESRPD